MKTLEACSLREAGLKLAAWFGVGESSAETGARAKNPKVESPKAGGPINPPLGFGLKNVDYQAGWVENKRRLIVRSIHIERMPTMGD